METVSVRIVPRENTFVFYNAELNELLFTTYDASTKMYIVERLYPCGTVVKTLMNFDNIMKEREKYSSTWESLGIL